MNSLPNLVGFFFHFPKALGLTSFPKSLLTFLRYPNNIFSNPKTKGVKFLISQKFGAIVL